MPTRPGAFRLTGPGVRLDLGARGAEHPLRIYAVLSAKGADMGLSFTGKKRIRKSFGRIPETVAMPNLIEVQKSSYEHFLMKEMHSSESKSTFTHVCGKC